MSEDISNKWEKLSKDQPEDVVKEVIVEDNESDSSEVAEAPSGILGHPDYQALQGELTKAEQTAHDNWEKAVRAQAELDNVRKRAERDVQSAHKFGQEKLIEGLLPVVDSLEQALQVAVDAGESGSSMVEGLELTLQLFLSSLEKHGVKQLNPIGEKFDPNCHEAMSMVPSDEYEAGAVMQVIQKGYLLNERVIRAARVIVVKD